MRCIGRLWLLFLLMGVRGGSVMRCFVGICHFFCQFALPAALVAVITYAFEHVLEESGYDDGTQDAAYHAVSQGDGDTGIACPCDEKWYRKTDKTAYDDGEFALCLLIIWIFVSHGSCGLFRLGDKGWEGAIHEVFEDAVSVFTCDVLS